MRHFVQQLLSEQNYTFLLHPSPVQHLCKSNKYTTYGSDVMVSADVKFFKRFTHECWKTNVIHLHKHTKIIRILS